MSTKTNVYYRTMYARTNKIKEIILSIFYGLSSYPRLLAEVILRRNMGIRYFSTFHAVCLTLLLLFIPFVVEDKTSDDFFYVIGEHWGWYLYTVAFIYFAIKRHKECRTKHGVYDFSHFTVSAGKRLPFVENLKINGKPLDARTKNVYVEPLLIAAAGALFLLLGQNLIAALLLVCALIYSMSYVAAFEMGRQMILDNIDNIISGRELANVFKKDKPASSGFEFYGVRPTTEEAREGIAPLITGNAEAGSEVR